MTEGVSTTDRSDALPAAATDVTHAAALLRSAHKRMEDDATYFNRRAREERQAYLRGHCRRSRQAHLELAEAYEFRAHLITREVRKLAADELVLAL